MSLLVLLQMAVRTKNYGYVRLSCTSRFLAHLANKIETLMLWRGTRLSVRSQESLLLLRFESSLHRVVTEWVFTDIVLKGPGHICCFVSSNM